MDYPSITYRNGNAFYTLKRIFELAVKKKDEMKMKKLKAMGAMCIALCVISVVLIPTAVSYQDDGYIKWATEKKEMSNFYDEKIIEALSERDWSSLKLYSDLSYNHRSDVLDEIDKFDTPPSYLSKSKDEDKASCEDMKWAAYYANKIADAYLSGEGYNDYYFQMMESHLESVISHNEKGLEYLAKSRDELVDAETPGFGAILAIICVLVVGYFVKKRKSKTK